MKASRAVCEGDVQLSKIGQRRAILNDLSPAAAFIAYNYNSPADIRAFQNAAKDLLQRFEQKYGWMYRTKHKGGRDARINFVVWSDVFACNHCQGEIVFWNEAVEDGEVKDDTTDVLLESAWFEPTTVRLTSRRLGLRTIAVPGED